MKKNDDIELEMQETVVEEPAVQEEVSMKDEAAEMKEQAKKTIQLIKEKAKEEDPRPNSSMTLRTGSPSDMAFRANGCILYCLCCYQIPMSARHVDHRQAGKGTA